LHDCLYRSLVLKVVSTMACNQSPCISAMRSNSRIWILSI